MLKILTEHIVINNKFSTLREYLHSHIHCAIIWMHKEIVRWWRVLVSLEREAVTFTTRTNLKDIILSEINEMEGERSVHHA